MFGFLVSMLSTRAMFHTKTLFETINILAQWWERLYLFTNVIKGIPLGYVESTDRNVLYMWHAPWTRLAFVRRAPCSNPQAQHRSNEAHEINQLPHDHAIYPFISNQLISGMMQGFDTLRNDNIYSLSNVSVWGKQKKMRRFLSRIIEFSVAVECQVKYIQPSCL